MKARLLLLAHFVPALVTMVALSVLGPPNNAGNGTLLLLLSAIVTAAVIIGFTVSLPLGPVSNGGLWNRLALTSSIAGINLFILFLGCVSPGVPSWEPQTDASSKKEMAKVAAAIPVRAADLHRDALDISTFFNATLTENFNTKVGVQNLKALPSGSQTFNQVQFDVRGGVRVCSQPKKDPPKKFPTAVRNIAVDRTCRRLHFLHGNGWELEKNVQVSKYLVHYSGNTKIEIPIENGRDILATWVKGDQTEEERTFGNLGGMFAWKNSPSPTESSSRSGQVTSRLYITSWQNPRPQIKIDSIDFESLPIVFATPLLLAVTVEPIE